MANIRTQTPPNLIGAPKVNIFNKEDFNAALWENGYDVILEEAVACPCKGQSSDNLVTCSNCLGTGWVFINPIRTKAFISSINRSTKYKDWSPEMIGTIAATFMDTNRISFMDKITMLNFTSEMSEVLSLRNYNSHKFVFCTYRVSYIKSIFLFSSENELLTLVDPSLYTINNNSFVVDIDSSVFPVGFNGKVSIRYRHRTTYNILDIPHDMRMTKEYSNNGTKSVVEMPIQCIARKSQYELGSVTNYEGDNVNDNSYLYSDISATVFPPITGEAPPLLKGNDGKSAYQSYLDTTEDDPPLSEVGWVESLKGEGADVIQDQKLKVLSVSISDLGVASLANVTNEIVANYLASLSLEVAYDELLTLEVVDEEIHVAKYLKFYHKSIFEYMYLFNGTYQRNDNIFPLKFKVNDIIYTLNDSFLYTTDAEGFEYFRTDLQNLLNTIPEFYSVVVTTEIEQGGFHAYSAMLEFILDINLFDSDCIIYFSYSNNSQYSTGELVYCLRIRDYLNGNIKANRGYWHNMGQTYYHIEDNLSFTDINYHVVPGDSGQFYDKNMTEVLGESYYPEENFVVEIQ